MYKLLIGHVRIINGASTVAVSRLHAGCQIEILKKYAVYFVYRVNLLIRLLVRISLCHSASASSSKTAQGASSKMTIERTFVIFFARPRGARGRDSSKVSSIAMVHSTLSDEEFHLRDSRGGKSKFSEVISLLNWPYNMAIEQTFENFFRRRSWDLAGSKFSQVRRIVVVSSKFSDNVTFENVIRVIPAARASFWGWMTSCSRSSVVPILMVSSRPCAWRCVWEREWEGQREHARRCVGVPIDGLLKDVACGCVCARREGVHVRV